MNFELAEELNKLLVDKKLQRAIELAESKLIEIPETSFHKILGRNLLENKNTLVTFISSFNQSTTKLLNQDKGFINKIFSKKTDDKPVAFYCEMNGFTINYDRWYMDLFSFKHFDNSSWEWLSDFYDNTESSMTIKGFEDIQTVFKDVHEKEHFESGNVSKAYEVCELLVILRLHELFKETYAKQEQEWSNIPIFITAHDYELIYSPN